ncbi:MAG: TIGR03618 family F420-dependent PPOX class oxidoreductase [Acidimicrobiales bacterium]|nr:TIGR03618 family F420-dependent PPOX class oxidoreductase [Acidimicrobiales bacterium]
MLDPKVVSLAQAANFAALTTLLPDGQPQTHVMWVDADDTRVLINTELHRQKAKNVQRDPRVTVAIIAADNPYDFVEVRGRVVEIVRGEIARAHIDALALKYTGKPYGMAIQSERVILRIEPTRTVTR